MHLGGGLGLDAGFGRKLRGHKVTADDLPDYVERLARNYLADRETGERFAQWVARADEAVARVSEPGGESVSSHTATRRQILYCPYCAEETLFPLETAAGNAGAAVERSPSRSSGLRPTPGRTEES